MTRKLFYRCKAPVFHRKAHCFKLSLHGGEKAKYDHQSQYDASGMWMLDKNDDSSPGGVINKSQNSMSITILLQKNNTRNSEIMTV